MATLSRLFDFAPSTVIVSADVDSEFNQLVNILNGTSTNKDALIKFSDATNPVLRVDQISTGAIQQWLQNGTEKASIRNNGSLRINSSQEPTGASIGVNADSNNNPGTGHAAAIQTTGTGQIGQRIAMEAATSGGVTAFQITKFESAAVQQYFSVKTNGETRIAAGHPSTTANVPTGVAVALGGQYLQNVSVVGNVGAGEDDLHSHTIAANVLANDGDSIQIRYAGTFANNANNKTVRSYFGGTKFFDTSATAFQNGGWSLIVDVTRISSSAAVVAYHFGVNAASGNVAWANQFSVTGLTYTGTLIAKCTGEATSNDDITQTISLLRKFAKGS